MVYNIYRYKLVNAILYFARETNHLTMTKLFKLLNFFDFEHFAETGYPAIGLRYETFEHGPVPRKLWLDVKDADPPGDIAKVVNVTEKFREFNKGSREVEFKARPSAKPNMDIFTPREKRILDDLAFIYKDATATQMSDISHEKEKPWQITMDKLGLNAEIDYMLARGENSPISNEEAQQSLNEHFAIVNDLGLDPNG